MRPAICRGLFLLADTLGDVPSAQQAPQAAGLSQFQQPARALGLVVLPWHMRAAVMAEGTGPA